MIEGYMMSLQLYFPGQMPRKMRTERDRVYQDRLRTIGPLSNVELASEVKKHPAFREVSDLALRKDISRYVKRELGKTISRVNGKLTAIPEEGQEARFSFDLMQIQVSVRDTDSTKKLHVCWHEEVRNISRDPIKAMSSEIFSAKPQSLEEYNPVVRIKQGSLDRTYAPKDLTIDKKSTPYNIRFDFDLPRKLREGQSLTRILTHDSLDLDPDFTLIDLAPTKRLIFDLIKTPTDTEELDCMVIQRHERKGPYVSEIAEGHTVTDIRTGHETYALRLVLEDPKVGRDYRFEYRI